MVNSIDEEMSGDDKFYELWLLQNKVWIDHWKEVVVLDEKVSKHQQFSPQCTRWISSQYTAFATNTGNALAQLLRGNMGYFDKWLEWGFIPKFILLDLLPALTVVDFLLGLFRWAANYFLTMGFAFAFAIPRERYNRKMLNAIFYAPIAMLALVKGILGFKKDSAKTFNVTEKGSNT